MSSNVQGDLEASRPSTLALPDDQTTNEKGEEKVLNAQSPSALVSVSGDSSSEQKVVEESFEVKFAPDDPLNPQNWSRSLRWYYTVLASILVFSATFASSSPSGMFEKVKDDLHMSNEVATLMITTFLLGYVLGPLFWGPLSENYGRKPIFVVSFFLFTCFQVGCALSPNAASLLVFRFLSGCGAASPLANSGALLGDIWDMKTRGLAISYFTLAPFGGPAMGPMVAGFIADSKGTTWRWLYYVLAIFSGACLALVIFTLPETYPPIILKKKAQVMRKETGDDRWYAPLEQQMAQKSWAQEAKTVLTKPLLMLVLEPLLLAVTIYMSFVYGCLYLLFEAYPIVFGEGYGFNNGEAGLALIPLFLGGGIGVLAVTFYFNPHYVALMGKLAPNRPPPEARLPMGITGGIIFSIGFFWFGWTSYPSVSYWSPLISGLCFGFSLMLLFMSLIAYIVDIYLMQAASALSANTMVRSLFGAAFPLFATQMYDTLNPRWASTLLGCVAVIMIPIPLLFIRYGEKLRKMSRFSATSGRK